MESGTSKTLLDRVRLVVSPALYETIMEVQRFSGVDSVDEVFRDALLTYLALVKEWRDGKDIIIRDKRDGKEVSYNLFVRN